MARPIDVVIFGASGFTGQFVVEEMAAIASKENIKWAVAGRNRHKVRQTLEDVRNKPSDDLKKIEIFEADVTNETSLDNMCKNAKLVINCVGPYEKYGEAVVMACLKNRTHLIDMTVEVMYINRMILRYYSEAESRDVYIFCACGIGYLPLEMAIAVLQKRFEGGISTIDCYLKADAKHKSVHFGTWESMVNMCDGYYEILVARQKISSQIMNRHQSKWSILSPSWPIKFSEEVKGLGLLVPSVLHTSQLSLDMKRESLPKRPTKVNLYIVINSWLALILSLIFIFFAICLHSFSFGKRMLLKYPELFSFGVVSKFDTSEKRDLSKVRVTLVAKGWRSKQHGDCKHAGNPDKTAVLRGSGPTGYKSTAICLVQSAVTVLKETDHLPNRGGIYTPLVAFAETTLPSRMRSHGITYQLNEN